MTRPLVMATVCFALAIALPGCRTPNGLDPHGDSLLFKTYGQFNSAIGRMELVKGLGLPYSVQNNLDTFDISKPVIFLPRDVESVSLRETYRIGSSTITIIAAPTQTCQYSYILLAINPNKTYFGRRIQSCEHDLRFFSDGQGVSIIEQNAADPHWWWMSNNRFAGPVLQSALVARSASQTVSPRNNASVAGDSPTGSSPSEQEKSKSGLRAGPHAAPAKPRPSSPKVTQPVQASAPIPAAAGSDEAPAKRLRYVSKVAMSFSMTSREEHETTHICLADGSTCGQ